MVSLPLPAGSYVVMAKLVARSASTMTDASVSCVVRRGSAWMGDEVTFVAPVNDRSGTATMLDTVTLAEPGAIALHCSQNVSPSSTKAWQTRLIALPVTEIK
jgi:hypothetical protein